jgi:uncharacterized protein YqjF (DUF2071 family)
MYQRWEHLLFLHWAVGREVIQRSLPHGLYADTFDGSGWLGIVPFAMRDVRPAGLPAIGPVSNFLELNVRTYVHDERGVPGVWFYSLDCNQPLAVLVAQILFGLPYRHAAMHAEFAETIVYESTRRGTDSTARYLWQPQGEGRTAATGSLEFFLLERYHLYAARGKNLYRGTVAHPPYEFREAGLRELSTAPATLDGFPDLDPHPGHICHADAVDVRILALEKVS